MLVLGFAVLLTAAACGQSTGGNGDGDANGSTAEPTPEETPTPETTESPRLSADSLTVVVGPQSVAGWWDGERWRRADGSSPVPVEGGESYALVGLTSEVEQATGSEAMEGCEIVPGSTKIEVPGLHRSFTDPLVQTRIAVTGVADPVPREAAQLPPSNPYVEAAASLLAERGLEEGDPDIVQVVRVDLDGDGRNEIVVVAESIADQQGMFGRVGDYSVVFVRTVVEEEVVTSVIAETVPEDEPGVMPFVQSHRVAAAADLNGDGRMELAVAGKYYEGAGVTFHELDGDGGMNQILKSGCGA